MVPAARTSPGNTWPAASLPEAVSEQHTGRHGRLLRPFRAADLELLSRLATDPDFSAPFEWSGFASAERQRQRFAKHGLLKKDPRYLAVAETGSNDIAFGFVTWREVKLRGDAT